MSKQNNGGGASMGAECAKLGAAGRESKSKAAKMADARCAKLREDGIFYEVKNNDRSDDIFALEAGVAGQYAFPGGSAPSAQFIVYNNGTPEKSFMVVRFEGSHRGHPLPGNLNNEVFLPIFSLFKQNFNPKHTGDWRNTQVAMFEYLTGLIDGTREEISQKATPIAVSVSAPLVVESISVDHGKKDLRQLATATNGDRFTINLMKGNIKGKILIEVSGKFPKQQIRVKASNFEPIRSDLDYFLPLHCLDYDQLTQYLSDELHAQMCELHLALRWAVSEAYAKQAPAKTTTSKVPAVKLVQSDDKVIPQATTPTPAVKLVQECLVVKPEAGLVDWSMARKLTAPLLIAKIKRDHPPVLVYVGELPQRAYFMREAQAGVQKLRLVKAEDHPTLTALIDTHPQGVDAELKHVIYWNSSIDEVGDLANMKNARLHLIQWMHSKLPEIGYKLKKVNQEVSPVTEIEPPNSEVA